jgi:hypothetical protein
MNNCVRKWQMDFQFFLSDDPKRFGGVGAVSARSRMERTANNA